MMRQTACCFLGIDVGTSGMKTLAVSATGEVFAAASAGYPLLTPAPGSVEQDPTEWWRATCATVRTVLDGLPGGASSVACVGLSGHMSSLVALDGSGRPLRPCITVADGRGGREAEWLGTSFRPRLLGLAGALPGTSDVAPKLLWLKANEPDTYARMATFVAAKDYVRFLLTGALATEPTDAGNTFFLDVQQRTWDVALYTDMGLDPAKLPDLVATTDVVGTVTPAAAAATGLLSGTPVVAGGADMATSVTGVGAVTPGIVAITIGTSAQVTTSLATLLSGAQGRVDFHPHAATGLLYLMGSIFSGGLTLQWLAKAFGEEDELGRLGNRYFDRLSDQAASSSAGSEGAMFLPFLVGSGTPDFDPDVAATYLGMSLATGRPQLVRAALEGVAFNARECVAVVEDLGLPVQHVHLGGGGAASPVWRTIIASVLGIPVRPVAVRDASALGAAALAAVGIGVFADVPSASRAMVHYEAPVEPEHAAVERYARDYPRYVRARTALADLYHRILATSGGT